jgi:hypothetical protein
MNEMTIVMVADRSLSDIGYIFFHMLLEFRGVGSMGDVYDFSLE